MQEVMNRFAALKDQPVLWDVWQEELHLRRSARISADKPGPDIQTAEDLDFLMRAWYHCGHRRRFLETLYLHMDHKMALLWLLRQPRSLYQDYLNHLLWKASSQKTSPHAWLFLISIFKNEWAQDFEPLINLLDEETCSYLLPKSANHRLRTQLQSREQVLRNERQAAFYGIINIDGHIPNPKATDKKHLFTQAAVGLNEAYRHYTDPSLPDRFHLLLQAGEQLKAAGLIQDAFQLLFATYRYYQHKNRLAEPWEEERLYKRMNSSLRSVLPLAVLFHNPGSAFETAGILWKNHFPRMAADTASLLYLKLYEDLKAFSDHHTASIHPEIRYDGYQIAGRRPEDSWLAELMQGELAPPAAPMQIISLVKERFHSLPHEAFILLELLRYLHWEKIIVPQQMPAGDTLMLYGQLWEWIPHPLFFNHEIWAQLSPLAPSDMKNHWQRLYEQASYFDKEKILQELKLRPELFRDPNDDLRRQILLSGLWEVEKV